MALSMFAPTAVLHGIVPSVHTKKKMILQAAPNAEVITSITSIATTIQNVSAPSVDIHGAKIMTKSSTNGMTNGMKRMNYKMNRMNTERFFEPFTGSSYASGINGRKVLVMGASFYCSQTHCSYFEECTSTNIRNSSKFNDICPVYVDCGKQLCYEPSYVVNDEPSTLTKFAKLMSRYTGSDDYMATWNRMAFTNYVQFFLPAIENVFRETRYSDISERDFESFVETLKQYQPDVVIAWGCVINKYIISTNPYITDRDALDDNDWYMCHMRYPDIDKEITIINTYHPSSSAWYVGLPTLKKYLDIALGLTDNKKELKLKIK